ncbi:MAG: hypothetical protein AB7L84_02225 [Acidimicrobiia bacterium]
MSVGTGTALTFDETAERVGGYVWLERALYELLGAWVPSVPEHDVKLRFGAQSQRHAWHGDLWFERLPVLRDVDRDALVRPATPALGALVTDLAGIGDTLERLVATYRVLLPALVASYSEHLDRVSPLADATVERVLQLVVGDALDDWRGGERALRSLVVTPALVRAATGHQERFEVALLGDRPAG